MQTPSKDYQESQQNKQAYSGIGGEDLRFLSPASSILSAFLKHATAQAVFKAISFGAIMFLCTACASYSPGNPSGWGNPASPAPAGTVPATAGQKPGTPSGESPQPQGAATVPGQTPPEQAAPSGWSSAGQGRQPCGPPIPENEGFLHKVVRILSGPDRCGPDLDVDTNISAGGAAGG
jgi:hypothetical protein